MAALLIRHGEWVVVCDGAKALVLENDGDIRAPNLKTVQVFEQKDDGDPSEAPMRRNRCAAALKARLRIFLASSRMPGTCERRPCADVRS